MPPTTIRSPPSTADYTPLAEWQAQTPETFHGGKPVLYYHATGAKACVPKSQRSQLPFFPTDASTASSDPEASVLDEASEDQVEQTVDLFVNSETFTIFAPTSESGMTIPYQNITLHAIKHVGADDQAYPGVYLQLEFADGGEDDESYDTVELTIVPTDAKEETTKLFEAISECADLNPDPADDDDEDDDEDPYDKIVFEGDIEGREIDGLPGVYASGDASLPPPMPGSSGWITAENVHDFFDKDGNWIGNQEDEEEEGISGELGEGAGRVRGRDEVEAEAVNGQEKTGESTESKRPRNE